LGLRKNILRSIQYITILCMSRIGISISIVHADGSLLSQVDKEGNSYTTTGITKSVRGNTIARSQWSCLVVK